MSQIVMSAPPDGLEPLTVFGQPVFQSWAELATLLRQRLGPGQETLLARPSLAGERLSWVTDLGGPIRPWRSLDPVEQGALEASRRALGEDLARLVDDLAQSGINTRNGNLAQLLHAALEIPDIGYLHVVGDQLVLAFWGFRRAGGGAFDPFIVAAPPPPVAAMVRAGPVRRRLWPVLMVFLLVGLGLASLFYWLYHRPAPPTTAAEPAPVQESKPEPPKAAPALPKEAWDRHDLSMLQGCWVLGQDAKVWLEHANGSKEPGIAHAARLCLDKNGQGTISISEQFNSQTAECESAVTGHFDNQDRVVLTKPLTLCRASPPVSWVPASLLCERRDEMTAMCTIKDRIGDGQMEFHRAP